MHLSAVLTATLQAQMGRRTVTAACGRLLLLLLDAPVRRLSTAAAAAATDAPGAVNMEPKGAPPTGVRSPVPGVRWPLVRMSWAAVCTGPGWGGVGRGGAGARRKEVTKPSILKRCTCRDAAGGEAGLARGWSGLRLCPAPRSSLGYTHWQPPCRKLHVGEWSHRTVESVTRSTGTVVTCGGAPGGGGPGALAFVRWVVVVGRRGRWASLWRSAEAVEVVAWWGTGTRAAWLATRGHGAVAACWFQSVFPRRGCARGTSGTRGAARGPAGGGAGLQGCTVVRNNTRGLTGSGVCATPPWRTWCEKPCPATSLPTP